MSWTSLRQSIQSGFALRPAGTPLAGGDDGLGGGLGVAERGMAKQAQQLTLYAALAALVCGVVSGSVIAAPGAPGLFGATLGLLMIAIAIADARAYLIPDRLTLAAFLLGLGNAAAVDFANMPENIAIAAARGCVLAFAFFALRDIYRRLRHRQGLGLGDVKLAAVAGVWLDWAVIPAAIEIAALTALFAYMASQLILRHPVEATAKLPFGLFFAPAIWLGWLIGALFLQG
jgi:leader peptidase (prepilin peptidase) / N-methyltransferase